MASLLYKHKIEKRINRLKVSNEVKAFVKGVFALESVQITQRSWYKQAYSELMDEVLKNEGGGQ